MMRRDGEGVGERLRRLLLGRQAELIEGLAREVQQLRAALYDPEIVRPVVARALRTEISRAPVELAAMLRPVIEQVLRESEAEQRKEDAQPPVKLSQPVTGRRRRSPAWFAALVVLLITGSAGTGWTPQGPSLTQATEATAAAAAVTDPVQAAPPPLRVTLQRQHDGFGLGQAAVNDGDLAREVRSRLAACPALKGADISYSVTDGWVWLRGRVSAPERQAADKALAHMGRGVLVVNQLTVHDAGEALAQR